MVNAQEWLNREYPKNKSIIYNKIPRSKVKKIEARLKDLDGSLDLREFAVLEELDIQNGEWDGKKKNTVTSLSLNSSLKELRCGGNKIKKMYLRDNENLVVLDCSKNELINLDLSGCSDLKELYCHNNQLPDIKFLDKLPHPEKLTCLNISGNHFVALELSSLNKFISLRKLFIGDNEFNGSLEPLRKMNNLEELNISNTDIDSGLEYLPKNLKEICCEVTRKRPEARCHVIRKKLEKYYNPSEMAYDYKSWVINELPQKKLALFEEQRTEVKYLEIRVQELINLVKDQKERITSSFSQFFPEKEFIQNLVAAHLEFTKAKKQSSPSIKSYRKKFNNLYEELEDKLDEKKMQELEIILNYCEELITWELELEAELDRQEAMLLEGQKQMNKEVTRQELILERVNKFLAAKKNFLSTRQETIEELKKCFNELKMSEERHGRAEETSSVLRDLGGVPITLGIPKFFGGAIKIGTIFFKGNSFSGCNKEFQNILKSDTIKLNQLNSVHYLLVDIIRKNEKLEISSAIVDILDLKGKLEKYRTSNVLIEEGIWENKTLTLTEMEKTIVSLSKNLKELELELEEEKNKMKNLKRENLEAQVQMPLKQN